MTSSSLHGDAAGNLWMVEEIALPDKDHWLLPQLKRVQPSASLNRFIAGCYQTLSPFTCTIMRLSGLQEMKQELLSEASTTFGGGILSSAAGLANAASGTSITRSATLQRALQVKVVAWDQLACPLTGQTLIMRCLACVQRSL
jgi:hypothetical protein